MANINKLIYAFIVIPTLPNHLESDSKVNLENIFVGIGSKILDKRKRNDNELALPDNKTYYKASVNKTVHYRHNRLITST